MAAATARTAGNALARRADKARDVVVRTPGPARTAGAAAAGLAGGLALGTKMAGRRTLLGFLPAPRRRLLGIPIGRKTTSEALADGVKRLAGAGRTLLRSADDVHALREQLERANRQSPIEVLLDGLTHRRGGHRAES